MLASTIASNEAFSHGTTQEDMVVPGTLGCLTFSGSWLLICSHCTPQQPSPRIRLPASGLPLSFDSSSTQSIVPCMTGPLLKLPLAEDQDAAFLLPGFKAGAVLRKYRFFREQWPHPLGYLNCHNKRENSTYLLNAHARPCARICSFSGRGSHTSGSNLCSNYLKNM